MLLVKPANRLRLALLQFFQRRPLQQEVARHNFVKLTSPVQRPGKVLFEHLGELIGKTDALTDDFTTELDQPEEQADLRLTWHPGFELVLMKRDKLQQKFRIDRVILGSAGVQGIAVVL